MSAEVRSLVSLAVQLDLLADREQSLAERSPRSIEAREYLSHRDSLRMAARAIEEIARRTDIGAFEGAIAALQDAGVA